MSENTHTPGPWQIVPTAQAIHPWVVGDADGGSIASCEPMGPWMSETEATANAHLIAVAPDMLAALKSFNIKEDQILGGTADTLTIRVPVAAIQAAAAAIAKAEGSPSRSTPSE